MRRHTPAQGTILVLLVQCFVALFAAVTVTALAVPGVAVAAPADGTIPPRSVPAETGKYYVVGPPVDGQREFLFAIAVKTLGDGTRYHEIFALNEGRPQPDGRQMVDATTAEPGWILVLPADAAGPDVRTGPLPEITRPATGPPPGESTGDSGAWFSIGLRVMLLVLAVLLVVWARVTLIARRRPARTTSPSTGGTDAGPVGAPTQPAAGPTPPDTSLTPPDTSPSPALTAQPAEQNAPGPSAGKGPPPPAVPATRVAATSQAVPGLMPDLHTVALLSPPTDRFASLTTELDCEGRPAWVRLVGARPTRWGSAYGWLPAGRPPPPSIAAVILGTRDGQRLWADLAHTPDALTVVGDPASARRHAATLVGQLGEETEVVVVADALGGVLPAPARRIPTPGDLHEGQSTTRLRVVVCSAVDAAALRDRLRRLPTPGGRRTVTVVVGPAPAARWSIRTTAEHRRRSAPSEER